VDECFRNIDSTMASNDRVYNDESTDMFEKPMAIDKSVLTVDTHVRVDLDVSKVGVSVLNVQIDDKVHDTVAIS
jgi:hypothetical protein